MNHITGGKNVLHEPENWKGHHLKPAPPGEEGPTIAWGRCHVEHDQQQHIPRWDLFSTHPNVVSNSAVLILGNQIAPGLKSSKGSHSSGGGKT